MSKTRTWQVAVLPGDGIGPEVIDEAERALAALGGLPDGPAIECTRFDWPSHAWHEAHGESAPADYLEQLAAYDAILLGALGDPGPTSDPDRYLLSDAASLAPLLAIRKYFDQWCCERPCRPLDGVPSVLADERAADIDMLVIRENSEGEYVDQGGRLAPGSDREVATQLAVFTRAATDRIIRHAFERARGRAAARTEAGREREFGPDPWASQVCLVTKRNAQRYWGELYSARFEAIAQEYPDVATRHELVDAACMKFVGQPWQFDVVVASNLHGDILTDLAAVLNGGMGVSPSCNINPADRARTPMFEPTHGSAPDIAGANKAGPAAMLFTTAMMLDWMGEVDESAACAGHRLRTAVADDLRRHGTPPRATRDVGDAVIAAIENRQ